MAIWDLNLDAISGVGCYDITALSLGTVGIEKNISTWRSAALRCFHCRVWGSKTL